jgi:hypothetical protein
MNMQISVLPKTKLGRWSIGLGAAFIILIWVKIQYFLPLPTFAIAAIGLLGFILSLVTVIKNKDRSILILIPILAGLIIVLWTAGELIFPH